MDTPAPIRRDRWGRYMVLPLKATSPVGYTRATTIKDAIDDKRGLIDWGKRTVAIGLAQRPDLVALIQATNPDDKRTLNGICERAAEAGGATARRDLGTAWHSIAEQAANDPNWIPPAPYDKDIHALRHALHVAGLEIVAGMNERMMVCDDWQIAGTADLILTDGTDLFFADYKTGSSVDLGSLGFSVQLAIYANCTNLYTQHPTDPTLDVREPMPAVSKSTGIIIHIQPGSGHCDLYWLDLEIGEEALELAMNVREMRKQKPLAKIVPAVQVKAEQIVQRVEAGHITDRAREAIVDRVKAIVQSGNTDAILQAWPADIPTPKTGHPYTIEQASQITAALSLVEKTFGLAFPEPEPTDTRKPEPKPAPRRIEEGAELVEADIANIKAATVALEPESKEWLADTVKAASRAKKNIRLTGPGGKMTERRVFIAEALCEAAIQRDDLLFRGLLEQLVEAPVFAEDIGRTVGNLTIKQAKKLRELALLVNQGLLVPTWFEDHVEFQGLDTTEKEIPA